ncbi:MAG: sulfatase-like hydrolase/transferase, partial [Deltaproteobacteria bacterium]|nr:sulfatase-like hydrolase/transferase [Deltaproteobacteria bacterium]
HMSEEEIKHIQAMYAGKLTMVDRWFGHFMEKIDLMGLKEDTAILFLSDHGLQLGDHGIIKKVAYGLYTELLEAPMMLMMPGQSPKSISGFVQECDIAPTILKQLGLELPESMTGLDFWPLVTGEKEAIRDHALGGFHTFSYIQDDEYHYFRSLVGEPKPQLFDLEKDPKMLENIAESKSDACQIMEDKLLQGLGGWTPPKELLGKRVMDLPYIPFRLKGDI